MLSSYMDKPGCWLQERQLLRSEARRRVAAAAGAAVVALTVAAPAAALHKNPGGIGQYKAPHGGSALKQ